MRLRRLVIGEVARFPDLVRALYESGPKRAMSHGPFTKSSCSPPLSRTWPSALLTHDRGPVATHRGSCVRRRSKDPTVLAFTTAMPS
jgi:hypothetical protein